MARFHQGIRTKYDINVPQINPLLKQCQLLDFSELFTQAAMLDITWSEDLSECQNCISEKS